MKVSAHLAKDGIVALDGIELEIPPLDEHFAPPMWQSSFHVTAGKEPSVGERYRLVLTDGRSCNIEITNTDLRSTIVEVLFRRV